MSTMQSGPFRIIPASERLGLARVEAAEYIGVSATKFDEMVKDGRMPMPKVIDARKVWSRKEVEHWFAHLPYAGQTVLTEESDLTIA